jgi:hypothetical protein
MHLRAVLSIVLLTSLGLCQNQNHPKSSSKSQVAAKRTHSSVSVPAPPKTNAANGQLTQLEKDTARTITEPARKQPTVSARAVPPIDKAPAKTPGKQKSAINFNYQQQRTNGHNTNTAPRPR